MNYDCTLLNCIHGLEIDFESFELGFFDIKITTEEALINDFFDIPTLSILGQSQLDRTKNLKVFAHNKFPVPKKDLNEKPLLAFLLKLSSTLSNALWLIKDSAVRFETGHLKYTDGLTLSIHSNILNSLYSNSIGEKPSTKFTADEIEQAKEYFKFLYSITFNEEDNGLENSHAEANRMNRAYYFTDLARLNFDIGTKVSLYCSAFECLFSVSNGELRHRLSETIANYLESDFDLKKEVYTKVKTIYDLRSTVTHGSGISKKLINNEAVKLKEIGTNCDEILRRCFTKIMTDQNLVDLYIENNNQKIGEYFTDLNFK